MKGSTVAVIVVGAGAVIAVYLFSKGYFSGGAGGGLGGGGGGGASNLGGPSNQPPAGGGTTSGGGGGTTSGGGGVGGTSGGASGISSFIQNYYGAGNVAQSALTAGSGYALPGNLARAVSQAVNPTATISGNPISSQVALANYNKALIQ